MDNYDFCNEDDLMEIIERKKRESDAASKEYDRLYEKVQRAIESMGIHLDEMQKGGDLSRQAQAESIREWMRILEGCEK